jgi:hypothetical protein
MEDPSPVARHSLKDALYAHLGHPLAAAGNLIPGREVTTTHVLQPGCYAPVRSGQVEAPISRFTCKSADSTATLVRTGTVFLELWVRRSRVRAPSVTLLDLEHWDQFLVHFESYPLSECLIWTVYGVPARAVRGAS